MKALQEFRQYQLSETADGRSIEIARSAEEVVCLAFDTGRQFFVSMHVLAEDFENRQDDELAFHRRASEAKLIRHPNVSVVYEVGEDEGTPYFVTEFIDGESLAAYLTRAAPLPEVITLSLLQQLARGASEMSHHPDLFQRCDITASRVTSYSTSLSDLTVKIADPGVAGRGGATSESGLCTVLAGVALAATGAGNLAEIEGSGLKGLLETSALGGTLRRMITAVADGEIGTIDALIRGIVRCMEDSEWDWSAPVEAKFMPLGQLNAQLRSAASIERVLGAEFELDFNDPRGSHVSGWRVVRQSDGRRYRVFQLPPARLCEINLMGRVELARARRKDRYLRRVAACWPDPVGGLYAEEDDRLESLAEYCQRRGGLSGDELAWIAGEIHSALDEANEEGFEIWGFGTRGIYLEGHGGRPILESGSTQLTVRGHPNLEALSEPCRFSVRTIGTEKALVSPDDYDSYIELIRSLPMNDDNPLMKSALSRFYTLVERKDSAGNSASERRLQFIGQFGKFLSENGLREEIHFKGVAESKLSDDAADLDYDAPLGSGVARDGFPEASHEGWNPIAKSVVATSEESGDPEIFVSEETGVAWTWIILVLLLLLGATFGALAYFFDWIQL